MKVSFQKALDAYAYKKFKVMSELSGKVYEPGRLPDWTLEEVEAEWLILDKVEVEE